MPVIDTLYRDGDVALRWLPGRSARLVVVFTGMHGRMAGETHAEFAASASMRGENDVLFVTDRRASWYAAPGLWRKVVRFVKEIRADRGPGEVVTLGNSMGGYGALLLPRDVHVARAIAFAPQATMDRGLLDDGRWPDVTGRWGALPERNVGDSFARTRTQYYVLAGGDCAEDMAHLALLPEARRVHRYVLPGARHNLARRLKAAELLADVVAAILKGRKARVETLLDGFGGGTAHV